MGPETKNKPACLCVCRVRVCARLRAWGCVRDASEVVWARPHLKKHAQARIATAS